MLESLEMRQLLTAVHVGNGGVTAYIDGTGALHVNGTGGSDYIQVAEKNGAVTDLTVGSDADSAAEIGSLLGAAITGVFIDGKAGDDEIHFNGSTVDAVVLGGDGNDLITVNDNGTGTSIADGQSGNDVLICDVGHNTVLVGENGNDVISGANFSGNVFIFAGNGNDQMILQGQGSFADGGNGSDTAVVIGNTLGTFRIESVTAVPL